MTEIPKMKRWMLVFTVEYELEPEEYEFIGDVAEEIKGVELTKILNKATDNHTWKHMMSLPDTDEFMKTCTIDPVTKCPMTNLHFQWDRDVKKYTFSANKLIESMNERIKRGDESG